MALHIDIKEDALYQLGKEATALNLLKEGFLPEAVARLTELPLVRIVQLKLNWMLPGKNLSVNEYAPTYCTQLLPTASHSKTSCNAIPTTSSCPCSNCWPSTPPTPGKPFQPSDRTRVLAFAKRRLG